VGGRYGLSLVLVSAGPVTFVFWILHSPRSAWALRALYVWTGVLRTLAAPQFWVGLGELYTPTQAKRSYSPVGTRTGPGAAAGGGAARVWGAAALDPGLRVGAGADRPGPRLAHPPPGGRGRGRGGTRRLVHPADHPPLQGRRLHQGPGRHRARLHGGAHAGRLRVQEHRRAHGRS